VINVIDTVDQEVIDWLVTVSGDTQVLLQSPESVNVKPAVSVYLMDINQNTGNNNSRRLPIQFSLSYLILTWSDNEKKAHELLGKIIVAAMDNEKFEVQLGPISENVWSAFGVSPRPGLIIRVPLTIERPQSQVPPIRSPIELIPTDLVPLRGVVLSPQRKPMADVNIELSDHRIKTRTDRNGNFYFRSVPVIPMKKNIVVKTYSNQFKINVDTTDNEHPVEIQLTSAEG